jgi:hypothetical protein
VGCDFLELSLPGSVGIYCATGNLEPSGKCTRTDGDAGWTKRLQSLQLLADQRKFGRVLVLVVVKRQERSSQASLVASAFRTTILIRVNLNFRLRQARLTPTTTQVATDDTKVRSNLPHSTTCQSHSALRHRDYHAEDLADLHTAEQRDGTLDASAAIDTFSIRSVWLLDSGFSAWVVWWQPRRLWDATLKIQRLTRSTAAVFCSIAIMGYLFTLPLIIPHSANLRQYLSRLSPQALRFRCEARILPQEEVCINRSHLLSCLTWL